MTPNTPTKNVFTDATFISVLITAVATVWQQSGLHLDWLGQFQTIAPLVLQILGALGIIAGHAATVSSPPQKLTILPGKGDTTTPALLLTLGAISLFLTGCPPVPPTTQPALTQPAPALTLPESRLILTGERVAYAFAASAVANAHTSGRLAGVEYDAALSGLAGLKQRINDNTAAVNSGKPIDLSTADNAFNTALDTFLALYIPAVTPATPAVPVPTP